MAAAACFALFCSPAQAATPARYEISVEEAWQRIRAGFQRGARVAPELSLVRANERSGQNGIYLRVYWAGAAMMLAVDLQLRERTGGKQSLDSALEQLACCCDALMHPSTIAPR